MKGKDKSSQKKSTGSKGGQVPSCADQKVAHDEPG